MRATQSWSRPLAVGVAALSRAGASGATESGSSRCRRGWPLLALRRRQMADRLTLRRLRSAGVTLETRNLRLGHKNGDTTTHYSAADQRTDRRHDSARRRSTSNAVANAHGTGRGLLMESTSRRCAVIAACTLLAACRCKCVYRHYSDRRTTLRRETDRGRFPRPRFGNERRQGPSTEFAQQCPLFPEIARQRPHTLTRLGDTSAGSARKRCSDTVRHWSNSYARTRSPSNSRKPIVVEGLDCFGECFVPGKEQRRSTASVQK